MNLRSPSPVTTPSASTTAGKPHPTPVVASASPDTGAAIQPPYRTALETLREHLDDIKRGIGAGSGEGLPLGRLLLKVPQIETPEQLALYADTAIELQHLPGIDTLMNCLFIQARRQGLALPPSLAPHATRRLLARYPEPYPLDALLAALQNQNPQDARWGPDAQTLIQALLAPYLEWKKTAAGGLLPGCVPPGLIDGLLQVLPTLDIPQLKAMVDSLSQLPRHHAGTARLLAACLDRCLRLFDGRTSEDTRRELPQERAARLQQVLKHLCSGAGGAPKPFPGLDPAIAPWERQLQADLLRIRSTPGPQSMALFNAVERCLMGLLSLLPHVRSAAELDRLERAARRAIDQDPPSPHANCRHLANRQKLQWVMGLADTIDLHRPTVDEVSNVLRLLLVAPSFSVQAFLLKAQRPDIQGIEGLEKALGQVLLDNPSPADRQLLQALNSQVGESLHNSRQTDHDRPLIEALMAALSGRTPDELDSICRAARVQLGLEQAITVFQERLAHALLAQEQTPKPSNRTHNRYYQWLITLVTDIGTPQDVDALKDALQRLPAYWDHSAMARAVRELIRRKCEERQLSPHASLGKAQLDVLLASLRSLLADAPR